MIYCVLCWGIWAGFMFVVLTPSRMWLSRVRTSKFRRAHFTLKLDKVLGGNYDRDRR